MHINVGIARNPLEEIAMLAFLKKRRSFLVGAASIGVAHALLQSKVEAQTEAQGYVLGAAEGEHLVHYRNPGNIFIKVDPVKGSNNVACGTQQVPIGAGIPIHRHFEADEAFYILDGGGTFILNDVRHPFEKGGTIFIPKNSWHGFANPDSELLLLWIVTPTGLDAFFRETCNPPGVPPKQLTREQVNQIARKYGTEYR